jgi:YHS domain-containing protein
LEYDFLKGYDAVAYFTQKKPVKGNPAIKSTYQGATYLFSSTANKTAFDKNPAKSQLLEEKPAKVFWPQEVQITEGILLEQKKPIRARITKEAPGIHSKGDQS